jgi:hypothetical protein
MISWSVQSSKQLAIQDKNFDNKVISNLYQALLQEQNSNPHLQDYDFRVSDKTIVVTKNIIRPLTIKNKKNLHDFTVENPYTNVLSADEFNSIIQPLITKNFKACLHKALQKL